MIHLLSECSLSRFPQRVINSSVAQAKTVGYFRWYHSAFLNYFLGSLSSQDWSLNDHTKMCGSATNPQTSAVFRWNHITTILLPAPCCISDLDIPGES